MLETNIFFSLWQKKSWKDQENTLSRGCSIKTYRAILGFIIYFDYWTQPGLHLFYFSTSTLLRNPLNRHSLDSFNFSLPECSCQDVHTLYSNNSESHLCQRIEKLRFDCVHCSYLTELCSQMCSQMRPWWLRTLGLNFEWTCKLYNHVVQFHV